MTNEEHPDFLYLDIPIHMQASIAQDQLGLAICGMDNTYMKAFDVRGADLTVRVAFNGHRAQLDRARRVLAYLETINE